MEIKDNIRNYWDYRSSTYSNGTLYTDEKTRAAWLGWLRSMPGQDKPLKILDVGTGPGFLALLFAELGHDVTGVDLSGQMAEQAKANAQKAGLKATFLQGDAEKLAFPDGHFDLVASKYLLWTLPEPEKAVKEWMRVVKTGGTVMAIDGEWHKSDVVSRIRSGLAGIFSPKAEYRSRFEADYSTIKADLPLYEIRPAKVIAIFENGGLSDVSLKTMDPHYNMQGSGKKLADKIAPSSTVYSITGRKA